MVEGYSRWLDRIVNAGLIALVLLTPMAFGTVHRWAFVTMEAVIFGLVAAWMVKLCVEAGGPLRDNVDRAAVRRLAIPAVLTTLLVAAQIVPTPPSLMRTISPATYRLYRLAFPGWPQKLPYAVIAAGASEVSVPTVAYRNLVLLPPVPDAQAPRPETSQARLAAASAAPAQPTGLVAMRWRTLSIAPSVTWSGLVEIIACGSLFFLVLLYQPGLVGDATAENRFIRGLLFAILASAGLVALVGLAEREFWNGRILWFFIPYDWGVPLLWESPRASGPFVNPDHFANYLAMVLPLAAVGALFPLPFVPSRRQTEFRLACGVGALLMTAGIMLSLSRGGWLAATLAVCVALALSFRYAYERAPALLRQFGVGAIPLSIAGFVAMIVLVLYMIGPAARTYVGARVGGTVLQGDDLSARPAVWADTLGMMRDFPLFGVGLGAWPDLFPHYERPPWFPFFFREAENDYFQFTAETGLIGLALLLWLALELGRQLGRVGTLTQRQWPLYAGLTAGIAAMVVHEFFDFSLHTPANAVLFAVILATSLRVGRPHEVPRGAVAMRTVATRPHRTYLFAGFTVVLALVLIAASLVQDGSTYPYDLEARPTLARAEVDVMGHPAAAAAHLRLAKTMPGGPVDLRRDEIQAAVWLNPNEPSARDLYARTLMLAGDKKAGLAQITSSVTNSPELGTHYYLDPRAIPWLLPDEQAAVDGGFRRALARGYNSSFSEFAKFYILLGRYHDAAEVDADAARRTDDDQLKATYLADAGTNYAKAADLHDAEPSLRAAIALDPYNPKPYGDLARWVLLPKKNVVAALSTVDDGIRNGADPFDVNLAIAHAAEECSDLNTAATALERALKYRSSFPQMMELGGVYNAQARYDRAVLTYRQATELQPDSAQAFHALGQAEEAAYDYMAAAKDYQHAAQLAPDNREYRQTYIDFQRRTAKSAING